MRYGFCATEGTAKGSGDGGGRVGVTTSFDHRGNDLLVVPLKFYSGIDDGWDCVVGVAAAIVIGIFIIKKIFGKKK